MEFPYIETVCLLVPDSADLQCGLHALLGWLPRSTQAGHEVKKDAELAGLRSSGDWLILGC